MERRAITSRRASPARHVVRVEIEGVL